MLVYLGFEAFCFKVLSQFEKTRRDRDEASLKPWIKAGTMERDFGQHCCTRHGLHRKTRKTKEN